MSNAVRRMMFLKEDVQMVPHESEGQTYYVQQSRTVYLDVTGEDLLGKVALSILESRFGRSNNRFKLEKPVKPEALSLAFQAEWEATSEVEEGDEGFNEYMEMKAIVDESILQNRRYSNDLKEYEAIIHCIETEDERLAFPLLESRRHRLNEGYDYPVYLLDSYPGC
jgi:hypothetical protein